ncbi:antitoxin protein of toxin-antitoxin system [Murinocardiopsis flavida]|uniref:Antitoxin protein of toxin-antitoxin system n=1 Tax=Murinocardiopsis flavida TaxID=645275 RepID=A0A2P8CCA3_9ACTN|nr:antitoxin [Murinocardiopsis flavida]PSK82607.1 antitoxin protein of toxin-antitoxin system [Murinocardiopsis flavida]
MGAFGDGFDKLKDAAKKNKDKVEQGLDKGAEFVKGKTGGKYDEQIDRGRTSASKFLDEDQTKPDDQR